MEIEKIIPREITSERAQRYKRNTIGLSALLIILLNFNFIDYSNSKIFGIAIKSKSVDSDVLIYSILGAILLYNLVMYGTLLWRDWKIWKMSTLNRKTDEISNYPQFRMYLGLNPSDYITRNLKIHNISTVSKYNWSKSIQGDRIKWNVSFLKDTNPSSVNHNAFNGTINSSKYIKIVFINFLFQDVLVTAGLITTVILSYLKSTAI